VVQPKGKAEGATASGNPPVTTGNPQERPKVANKAASGPFVASAGPASAIGLAPIKSAALAEEGKRAAVVSSQAEIASPAVATTPLEVLEDQPLILVQQVEPEYPVAIVRRQKRGAVLVRFEVQVDGSVKQPEVLKSSNPRLDASVLSAVSQWRFQPLSHPQSASAELAFDVNQTLAE
jgi:TonB family protein